MDPVGLFRSVCADPASYARRWKEKSGGKVVAHTCSYMPQEVVRASGALCFRLFGRPGDFTLSDAHLQAYCCSPVRGILNHALSGELDFIDGVVFPHTCDSMQRLSDIWRINIPFSFHDDLVLPVKLDTGTAKSYMADVLKSFVQRVGQKLDVEITDSDLEAAIARTNSIRATLGRLSAVREKAAAAFSGADLHAATFASMVMDPEEWLEVANSLLSTLEGLADDPSARGAKRVVLSGGVCASTQVHEAIEKSGGVVVHDDLCTGARYYEGLVAEGTGDPILAIAERYRTRIVCPAKHYGIYARGEALARVVREKNAGGVVFITLKFCEPHAFDYPYLKKTLDDIGVPSLLLETEAPWGMGEQERARIEAFMEIVREA